MSSKALIAFLGNGITDDLVESGIDLDYFKDIPNAHVAAQALDLIANPSFVRSIGRKHGEHEIADLKRSVYRSCIAYGVPLPSRCVIESRALGIIAP